MVSLSESCDLSFLLAHAPSIGLMLILDVVVGLAARRELIRQYHRNILNTARFAAFKAIASIYLASSVWTSICSKTEKRSVCSLNGMEPFSKHSQHLPVFTDERFVHQFHQFLPGPYGVDTVTQLYSTRPLCRLRTLLITEPWLATPKNKGCSMHYRGG